jgi:hypothetical protein
MQTSSTRLKFATLLVLAASAVLPVAAHAALSSGPTSTVVYAGGNDLVLKSSDGKLLNFTVPSGTKFTAGDKTLSLGELKPGTKLTKPVVTGFDPKVVSSISVQKGKVFGVTPPDGVTLALAEGTKDLVVPTGTSFVVDGNSLTVGQLKPGMMVEATIVTTGADDAASATSTPAMAGVLLVSNPAGEGDLPAAGTNLPLFGVLGLLSLSLGFAVLRIRKPLKQS